MRDEKIIIYREWCLEWYRKEYSRDSEEYIQENKNEIIKEMTRKLNLRLSNILPVYYGKKSFSPRYISRNISYEPDMTEIAKKEIFYIKEQGKKYRELESKKKAAEKELEGMPKKTPKIYKENKKREINRYKQEMEKIEDYCLNNYENEEKRFERISKLEKIIFEFLLDDKKYGLLKSKELTYNAVWCRKKFIILLKKLLDEGYEHWEITKQDIDEVYIRFFYPHIEEMIEIYDALTMMEKSKWNDDIVGKVKRIHNNIDYLYKQCVQEDKITQKDLEAIINELGTKLYQE